MGQLAGRLKELACRHGGDERAWQPRIDAVAALEGLSDGEAHARFLEVKKAILHGRLRDLHDQLRAASRLTRVPDLHVEDLTERGVERAIGTFETALADARALDAALTEAREHHGALRERATDADFSSYDRVPYDELPARRENAEALRRRLAGEGRVEARYREARARASKLKESPVDVPDLSRTAVPDAERANALLDGVEAELKDAERVNGLHRQVQRALRNASVRDFKGESRKRLLGRADEAARREHRASAARELQACLDEAEVLAREAAGLARQAARSRRRGAAGPERERRAGDLQDYYG